MAVFSIPPDEAFDIIMSNMSRKSRRIVVANMQHKPYEGTRLGRELKNAKNRTRDHQRGESGDL